VEQVASDRLLPRRGEVALERQAGMRFGETPGRQERDLSHRKPVRAAKPQYGWIRLCERLICCYRQAALASLCSI
jgi:hypothetical protein